MAESKTPITDVSSLIAAAKEALVEEPDQSADTKETATEAEEPQEEAEEAQEVTEETESQDEEKPEESKEPAEEKKESKLDLHKTFARKEKEWVAKEQGYKSENTALKNELQHHRRFLEELKRKPSLVAKLNPRAYEEWTEEILGMQPQKKQEAATPEVLELRKQVEAIRAEIGKETTQKAIREYKGQIQTLAQSDEYERARRYCERKKTTLWDEATIYADILALRTNTKLTPEEALKAVADDILDTLAAADEESSEKSSKGKGAEEEKPRDDKGKFVPKSISTTMKSGSAKPKKTVPKNKDEYKAFLLANAPD